MCVLQKISLAFNVSVVWMLDWTCWWRHSMCSWFVNNFGFGLLNCYCWVAALDCGHYSCGWPAVISGLRCQYCFGRRFTAFVRVLICGSYFLLCGRFMWYLNSVPQSWSLAISTASVLHFFLSHAWLSPTAQVVLQTLSRQFNLKFVFFCASNHRLNAAAPFLQLYMCLPSDLTVQVGRWHNNVNVVRRPKLSPLPSYRRSC